MSRLRLIFPSLITLLGLCISLFGLFIFPSLLGKALLLLGLALDVLDGRAARYLNTETDFGAKFDFYSDVVISCAVITVLWGPLFLIPMSLFWAAEVEVYDQKISGRTILTVFATLFK